MPQPNNARAAKGVDLRMEPPVSHPGFQRFRVALPTATHMEPANCEEVSCAWFRDGWMTIATVGSEAEALIRADRWRTWTVRKAENQDDVLEFIFPAGQQCYREHQKPTGRPALLLHETSDRRLVHKSGEDFMNHAHEELDRHFRKE